MVPGSDVTQKDSEIKLLLCCIYGVFGMVVIGTCVSTIATVVWRKVVKLGQNIKKCFTCSKKVLTNKQKVRQEMINRLKLLKEYEILYETKNRKVHVLS